MEKDYLQSVRKQFEYYKMLGDKTFAQVSNDGLFWKQDEESNSIANIVKHLWGNMMSRWTDFKTTDGEKEWRNREGEFEDDIRSREEMLEKWEEGWKTLFSALDSVSAGELGEIIYIRNQGHTILEAINRQLAHYPYHIGQIVFIGKMVSEQDWVSLSIPRGGSKAFNEKKFEQPKSRGHYTEDFLGKA
jgi:hypothetical protein